MVLTINAGLKLIATFLVPSKLGIKINFQPEASTVPDGYLKDPGTYLVSFNAANLPRGLYFYQLQCGDFSMVRKMMLLK